MKKTLSPQADAEYVLTTNRQNGIWNPKQSQTTSWLTTVLGARPTPAMQQDTETSSAG